MGVVVQDEMIAFVDHVIVTEQAHVTLYAMFVVIRSWLEQFFCVDDDIAHRDHRPVAARSPGSRSRRPGGFACPHPTKGAGVSVYDG